MRFWAQHILYFSAAVILSATGVYADDEDYSKFTDKPVNQKEIEAAVGTFQKEAPAKEDYKEFRKKDSELREIYNKYYGKDAMPEPKALPQATTCENTIQVDYYFSFSMPETSITAAVADALALRKNCYNVNMYLRGLIDNDLKKTITTFYSIAKANPEDLPIEIDPVKFQKESIKAVPTIIVNGKRLTGDMRLSGVIYNIDALQAGKIAVTYHVKEEDLAELFKRRAYIAKQKMQEFVDSGEIYNKFKLTRYDGKFSEAKKKYTYYVDPTHTLQEDIVDNNGMVLFPKGTTVNPLDQITLGKYIFIDGNKKEQVSLAIRGKYRKIILMSGNVYELNKRHKTRFYHASDELIDLFRVQRVPLIVEQEGRLVRATEQPI